MSRLIVICLDRGLKAPAGRGLKAREENERRRLEVGVALLAHPEKPVGVDYAHAPLSSGEGGGVLKRAANSPYVSIRQHTSAYVSIRQHTSACTCAGLEERRELSIRQHTSAYVSIHQHTSAYVSMHQRELAILDN
jgi:hypothetical protein